MTNLLADIAYDLKSVRSVTGSYWQDAVLCWAFCHTAGGLLLIIIAAL